MLNGICQGMRAFAEKVRIKLFAVKDSLRQNIPSAPVFLSDPGADTRCQRAGKRTKDGRKSRNCLPGPEIRQ
jgi:hypothetical protein